MPEGQSQRSVASSAQHWQEAEVAATEECERAAVETAATAARAARLAMVELAATKAEVEAAAAADAARAAAAKLKALRASSTGNSVSADDERDYELKLAREAALTGADASAALRASGGRAAAVPPTAVAAQTGADRSPWDPGYCQGRRS
jgi:hypothetical protein